jgi:hypothetical protein
MAGRSDRGRADATSQAAEELTKVTSAHSRASGNPEAISEMAAFAGMNGAKGVRSNLTTVLAVRSPCAAKYGDEAR